MTNRPTPKDEAAFYRQGFTRAEMADLDKALGESLRGEIGMLRIVMRRFFDRAAQEANDLDALADVVRVLGLSVARLAKVLQTEQSLQSQKAGDLGEALTRSLAAVLEELTQTNGKGEAAADG